MHKLFFVGLLCLAALQISQAADVKEALNNHIREQLRGYEIFLSQDDGSHKEDLTRLIGLYETALKSEDYEEKQTIVKTIHEKFSPEFGNYVTLKLEEYHVNADIAEGITFYKSLLDQAEHKAEVEKAIATLENLQKEADLKKKEEQFLSLDKSFSPEFVQFLKDNSLPKVNHDLQNVVQFFDNLLVTPDLKYAAEIKTLKGEANAALASSVSVDDKQKVLHEVTNPSNKELFEFLQAKFVEHN